MVWMPVKEVFISVSSHVLLTASSEMIIPGGLKNHMEEQKHLLGDNFQ